MAQRIFLVSSAAHYLDDTNMHLKSSDVNSGRQRRRNTPKSDGKRLKMTPKHRAP
ncbi:hypothetical protein [Sphingobacterium multivorum]|uniref:hypothetical protein n=1 Tax=Sphingobacterium multivorum TaxID=28454 RepID=UPI00289FCD48|nr:hypothetical protein [Sphingobacterium multivorum]